MKAEYFSHDYKARSDDKLVRVMMVHGLAGIGAYWCIIEMLFENDGYIMQSECERIAFELRTNVDFIKSIFNDFGLFKSDKKYFFSESCLERLNKRKEKSAKASASASVRWNDANALPPQSESNANGMLIKGKKSKVNESKEKEKKTREKKSFIVPIFDDVERYFDENGYKKESAKKFFDYYSVADWKDSKGNQVRNWKQKAQAVWFKDENKKQIKRLA